MRLLTTIDKIWLNVVLRASPNLTSHISYEAVASSQRALSDCAVLIYFVAAMTKYIGSLATAHARMHCLVLLLLLLLLIMIFVFVSCHRLLM